jgi:D-tyrosyl-tRNA(Tyr) deacylase
MKLVIQRVTEGQVSIGGSTCGAIRNGLVVLLGVGRDDTSEDADYLLDKLLGLRIFSDDHGKMNRSVVEVCGELLIISQFTLYGDCRKGRRPSFDRSAPPDRAKELYDYFVEKARQSPLKIATGVFQGSMQVYLVNDGPVTILVDSADRTRK